VDETHDFPTDDEDTDSEGVSMYKTPKSKSRPKVNRIWTGDTPRNETPRSKTRPSSALALLLDGEAATGLPSLNSSISSDVFEEDAIGNGSRRGGSDGWAVEDIDATPKPLRRSPALSVKSKQEEGYEPTVEVDEYDNDPPSITLKEILLAADTSHFDLLGMGLFFF